MLPNLNRTLENRKEPSGVKTHSALNLAGMKNQVESKRTSRHPAPVPKLRYASLQASIFGWFCAFLCCFSPLNMGHKKNSDKGKDKKKTVRTIIKPKKEIIANYENGVRVSDLALQYGMAKFTIFMFLKNKDIIKKLDVAKGVTMISKQRPQIMEDMEKSLLIFIKEKELAGNSISETFICEKALHIYDNLMKSASTSDGKSDDSFTFKASRGWFEKFKHRIGIHRAARHGEAASLDQAAAEKYIAEFNEYVKAEEFVSQQVFNCDNTGLF